MNIAKLIPAALAIALAACGGGDSPAPLYELTDRAPDFVIEGDGYTEGPVTIQRATTEAGTFTYTVTGTATTTAKSAADTLRVQFSLSGSGNCGGSGAGWEADVPAKGATLNISHTITCTNTGDGPWQIIVFTELLQGNSTVKVQGLTLRTARIR